MIAEALLCLIIGDSIALGLHRFVPECEVRARVGVTTSGWLKQFSYEPIQANTVIISLGSNDSNNGNLQTNLNQLRGLVKASRVYWVLPSTRSKNREAWAVTNVASKWGDIIIFTDSYVADGIHPNRVGYRELVQQIK